MELKKKSYTVGVIVARFQIHELHEAHKELIDTVLAEHPKVMIFLGLSPVKGSIHDPLDYQPRKQMLLEAYPHDKFPNLSIGYIKDNRSDDDWSKNLDQQIKNEIGPNDNVVLYGSRDSFLTHYTGKFETRELQATRYVSGSEIRAKIAQAPMSNSSFRAGAIWATFQRYPTVYSTVDVLVFDPKERRVLLARKSQEKLYRVVGGFLDIKDESIEAAALRELNEETGLTVGKVGLRYVGSAKVDDWRYASNPSEKIMTHLYIGLYSMGCPSAGDDVAEVCWFNYDNLCADGSDKEKIYNVKALDMLVTEHHKLWKMAHTFIDTNFPSPCLKNNTEA